jgi:multiple sugar transport system substrate-binding protein/sn-glycerol 3-phosphate transport system substrate-binding protein
MVQAKGAADFFVAGGTLRPDASSYVKRPTDDELFEHALAGDFCYVLTPRQMGKSSLMIRTDRRLKDEGVKTVIIDLTNIGTDVSIEQWYLGLLSRVKRRLRLEVDLEIWWGQRAAFGYLQRFTDFMREVVMAEVSEPVVIFIDEIDSTLSLDFRDDFFAGIRALHNARAEDPNLVRLTFVLLGVAAPTELITDRSRTPFNIGHEITLQEFSYQDAVVLQAGLESGFPDQGETIFKRIYYWTNGHPYLTQKLCLTVTESEDGQWNNQRVDALVTKLFLTEEARKETNLKFVQDRILANDRKTDLLKLYRKVLRGKDIEDDGQSLLQNQLKLAGLVKVESDILCIRNKIYRRAFNESWIKDNLPKVTPQRIALIASVLAVIAISIIVFLIIRGQGQEAEVQAQTYVDQFENSQSSDVRLVSLAGLIELGEPYSNQAEEMFWAMNDEDQIALFENVSALADFEDEIVIIVTTMYQDIPNTTQGNVLLDTMAEVMGDVTVFGAPRLKTEIEFWFQARNLVALEQDRAALFLYHDAWSTSEERGQPNQRVLFERGVLYSKLAEYGSALVDFQTMLSMDETDETWEEVIRNMFDDNHEMYAYWHMNRSQYPTLSGILPTPTPIPTSTLIPTPTEELIREGECFPALNGPLAGIDPRGQNLVWWHNYAGSREESLSQMVADFNATNECEIVIDTQYQGTFVDIRTKMVASILTGDLPGLAVGYQNDQAEYALNDALVDLGLYIDDATWGLGAEKDDFYTSFLEHSVHPDNTRLGFPTHRSMEGLYYNITWLKELGFQGNPPETPDEFHMMACMAAKTNGDGTGGFILRDDASGVAAWTFAYGGDIRNEEDTGYIYNGKETINAMTFLKNMYDDGCAYLFTEGYPNSEFAARRAIFTQGSSSGLPYYAADIINEAEKADRVPDEWGFTAIPHFTIDPVQNTYGADVMIPKTNPETQLAAWIFIKWFTTPEQQAEWIKITGYQPTRSSTLDLLKDYISENPQWAEASELLDYTYNEPSYLISYIDVRDLVVDAFYIIMEGADIQDTLDTLTIDANTLQAGVTGE